MGMTMTQKILAKHAGLESVRAGQLIQAKLDLVLGNDITTPVAINEFESAGFEKVFDKSRIAMVMDHFAPNKDIKSAEQCLECREFSKKYNIVNFFDVGAMGIEHALLPEKGLTAPGELIIGASDTVTSQFLLPHLDAFHRRYPNIHIRIISGRSYKVLGLLRAGRVDIAFASAPGDADDLEHIPCFETHSCFVAAPDYPCDFTRAYTTEEIAAFPLILLEKKASSRTYLEKYFLQSGVRLTPEIELGARSLLVDLAKIGFGVAGVTREFVQGELAAGEIRELSTAFSIPPRTVDLCMLRNVSPSAATERFARDVLEKLQGKSVSV